jgi:hypothetical protein
MTYQQEIEIAARIIGLGQKVMKAINGDSIFPFEMIQALDESREAFEDALEIVEERHPLRVQIQENIKRIEALRKMLQLEM